MKSHPAAILALGAALLGACASSPKTTASGPVAPPVAAPRSDSARVADTSSQGLVIQPIGDRPRQVQPAPPAAEPEPPVVARAWTVRLDIPPAAPAALTTACRHALEPFAPQAIDGAVGKWRLAPESADNAVLSTLRRDYVALLALDRTYDVEMARGRDELVITLRPKKPAPRP